MFPFSSIDFLCFLLIPIVSYWFPLIPIDSHLLLIESYWFHWLFLISIDSSSQSANMDLNKKSNSKHTKMQIVMFGP